MSARRAAALARTVSGRSRSWRGRVGDVLMFGALLAAIPGSLVLAAAGGSAAADNALTVALLVWFAGWVVCRGEE